jgi:predicted nicotinamide N-methyase
VAQRDQGTADVTSEADFVLATTRIASPPRVPEVRLHLADDAFALWRRVAAERGPADAPPPFWAFAWAGGQALARHVLEHPALVRGRSVLDLASGSGLVAIAAARAGAAEVTASDVEPLALAAIELNAALNGVRVAGAGGDRLDGEAGGSEVVLAGDVFYEQTLACRVLPFLERARARGADVLVGEPSREFLPRGRLEALAAHEVPVAPDLEGTTSKRATVWRLA